MQKTKLSPRRVSRSLVVQGLYYLQTNPKSVSEIEDFLCNNNQELYERANYELMHFLLDMASNNFAESLALYLPYSARSLNDIHKIEKAILVIAAIELQHSLSVPAPVIINEAIELAKLYGAEESFKFINGLVDRLASKLRANEIELAQNNKLNK